MDPGFLGVDFFFPHLRENQPKQRCGLCHEEGHNRRKYPNSCDVSTSGHVSNELRDASIISGLFKLI